VICTRCGGTGFLNLEQLRDDPLLAGGVLEAPAYRVALWIEAGASGTDVQVCDCCGNGETWYGERGQHFEGEAPETYDYNGGLPECN
jgi:hypothetical protein